MAAKRTRTRKTSVPKPDAIERRVFDLERCEIRAAGEGKAPVFSGYAAMFNELSLDLGGFRERIMPGAFDDTLAKGDDVRLLINHDSNLILGRTTADTVKLSVDEVGLKVEAPLPDTSYARDLQVSMERGDITQMSFGFTPNKRSWDKEPDPETGLPVQNLLSVELFDVSPVTFPAYPQTTAETRALATSKQEELARDAEEEEEVPAEEVEEEEKPDEDPAPADPPPDEEPDEEPKPDDDEEEPEEEERAGKVLSQKNVDALVEAKGVIEQVLSDAGFEIEENALRTRPDVVGFMQRIKEAREWDYDDDWEIYVLTSMVSLGSSFMVYNDDEADVSEMKQLLLSLTSLLAAAVVDADDMPAAAAASIDAYRLRTRLLELSR